MIKVPRLSEREQGQREREIYNKRLSKQRVRGFCVNHWLVISIVVFVLKKHLSLEFDIGFNPSLSTKKRFNDSKRRVTLMVKRLT